MFRSPLRPLHFMATAEDPELGRLLSRDGKEHHHMTWMTAAVAALVVAIVCAKLYLGLRK